MRARTSHTYDEDVAIDVASSLTEGFLESDLPFKVDLIDWAKTDEAFRKGIRRDGVTLQVPTERTR